MPRRPYRRWPEEDLEEEPTFTNSRRPPPPTPPRVYPIPGGWVHTPKEEKDK